MHCVHLHRWAKSHAIRLLTVQRVQYLRLISYLATATSSSACAVMPTTTNRRRWWWRRRRTAWVPHRRPDERKIWSQTYVDWSKGYSVNLWTTPANQPVCKSSPESILYIMHVHKDTRTWFTIWYWYLTRRLCYISAAFIHDSCWT